MIDLISGHLDRYELRERLGAGGMARVYKAWDTSLERLVAIKILHEHLADDPTFRERFEREAKFIAGFSHPNIVQVYDFNVVYRESFPLYYMVMSYIPGATLREVLETYERRNERMPRERVLAIVNNITDALSYAHLRGMVHRDVKPGNILLNEKEQAILTDFGIARMVQSNRLTQDGVSTGTPIYMSPEQASGKAGDPRSDLYSLGIIVYEMLAGRPPFADDTSLAVMLKHLNTTPPLLSEFIGIGQFDAFAAKALAKDPDQRFQTAEEFARAFRATYDGSDEGATSILPALVTRPHNRAGTTSVFLTLSQRVRENPRVSTAIIVVSLGAVALLLLLLFNSTALRNSGANSSDGEVVSMTADQLRYFTSNFDEGDPYNPYWQTSATEFLTRQFTPNGRYQMHNLRTGTAETSIYGTETVYRNMALGLTGRLEETSDHASAYGIVFRYLDEDNYNVFAVDGGSHYSIWVRVDGVWEELRHQAEEWTFHEAIRPIGEDNRLVLTVVANFITGYVNDQQVVRVTDSTLDAGRIGMYFATDSGEATVSIDAYEVYASVESMTSSRSQMGMMSLPGATSEATAESSESAEPTSTRFSFLRAPGTAAASDDPTATRSSFLSAPGTPRYTAESGTPLRRTPEPPAESSPYPEETALPDEE